jgi:CheY-like chemotaxis protein
MSMSIECPGAGSPAALPYHLPFSEPSRGRILVVDDSRLIRSVFSGALAGLHDCTTASSYEEALNCLRLDEFDVVLVAVEMAGISGIELLRKILADYPATQVIMLSSSEQSPRILDMLRIGAVDHLTKPCKLPILQLAIGRAMERRRLLLETKRKKREYERRMASLDNIKLKIARSISQTSGDKRLAALGRIAAGTAQELKNSVDLVNASLHMLKDAIKLRAENPDLIDITPVSNYASTSDLDEVFDDCIAATIRMRHILQDFSKFSRSDAPDSDMRGAQEPIRWNQSYSNKGCSHE